MTNTINKIIHNGDEYMLPRQKALVITLTSAGWTNNEQTVTATGVTANNSIIVSPAPTYISDYTDAEIYCSAQGTDSLTFTCDTTPSNDIEVNVLVLSAEAGSAPTPPSPGWQPGVNTILYLPMNSTDNFSDQSGNGYIGTGVGTYSINTIDGTECGDFQGGYIRFTGLQNINANNFTHIFWGNTNRPGRWEVASYLQANTQNDAHSSFGISNGGYYFMATNLYGLYDIVSDINNRSGWQMLAFVKDGTDIFIYINDEQPFTITGNNNSHNFTIFDIGSRDDVYSSQGWDGGLSNVILENKSWTAQEVADYYNQTKANYGIS